MELHPRIRHRIHQNRIAKEVKIQSSRITAVVKLNSVLGFLRRAKVLSGAIGIDDLIADIEMVRREFISFQIDFENPSSIRDAIAPHIDRIQDKLKQLELGQKIDSVAAPSG